MCKRDVKGPPSQGGRVSHRVGDPVGASRVRHVRPAAPDCRDAAVADADQAAGCRGDRASSSPALVRVSGPGQFLFQGPGDADRWDTASLGDSLGSASVGPGWGLAGAGWHGCELFPKRLAMPGRGFPWCWGQRGSLRSQRRHHGSNGQRCPRAMGWPGRREQGPSVQLRVDEGKKVGTGAPAA